LGAEYARIHGIMRDLFSLCADSQNYARFVFVMRGFTELYAICFHYTRIHRIMRDFISLCADSQNYARFVFIMRGFTELCALTRKFFIKKYAHQTMCAFLYYYNKYDINAVAIPK